MRQHNRRSLHTCATAALLAAIVNAGMLANASTASAAPHVVQLTFWYGLGGTLGTTIQQFVTNFNRTHPSVHVTASYEGSYSGGGQEQQKLLAAIAAGDPPNLAQTEVNSFPAFASAIRPVTKLMQSSKDTKPSDFIPGILADTQYDGEYYGVPWNRSAPVIIYNETMFKAHGISGPPKTWEQLASDAKTMTTKGVVGFEPIGAWWFLENAIMAGGARLMNSRLTKATFDTPAGLKAEEIRQGMLKDGTAKSWNTASNDFADTISDFGNGKTAMADMTNSSLSEIDSAVAGKFTWGVAPWPRVAGAKGYALAPGGANIAMFDSTTAAEVPAAWTFMQWMDSPVESAKFSEATGYMAVNKASLKVAQYKQFLKAHPQFAVPYTELPYMISTPASPHIYGVLEYLQEAQSAEYYEGVPIAKALATAQKESNGILGG